MVPSAIVGSFSEETMRRGARDRRGLRGEGHRRGQGHRAKRCGCTQILSSGTSIAKEHMGRHCQLNVKNYTLVQEEMNHCCFCSSTNPWICHIPPDFVVKPRCFPYPLEIGKA